MRPGTTVFTNRRNRYPSEWFESHAAASAVKSKVTTMRFKSKKKKQMAGWSIRLSDRFIRFREPFKKEDEMASVVINIARDICFKIKKH